MSKSQPTHRRILMLAYDRCQVLDISGPLEAFGKANALQDSCYYDLQLLAPKAGTIRTNGVLQLADARGIDEFSEADLSSVDTLVVAGGSGVFAALQNPAMVAFIRCAAKRVRRVVSVCSGAFLLAEAGLLNGRRATTHWDSLDDLGKHYPSVEVDDDAIYVRDGHIWTSAGVTAGIDMTLALIEEDLDSRVALRVARELVVYMMRPGGQAQFSAQLKFQRSQDKQLRQLTEWIDGNPAANLSVGQLAGKCAMSERNFTRRFTRELGVSPARFVEQSRFQHARRKLEETDFPLQKIADLCGFNSAEVLRRLFNRRLGLSPSDYRKRFRTSIRTVSSV